MLRMRTMLVALSIGAFALGSFAVKTELDNRAKEIETLAASAERLKSNNHKLSFSLKESIKQNSKLEFEKLQSEQLIVEYFDEKLETVEQQTAYKQAIVEVINVNGPNQNWSNTVLPPDIKRVFDQAITPRDNNNHQASASITPQAFAYTL